MVRLNSLDHSLHIGVVMLHAGERMLVAALPERFESLADHLGMLRRERSALDGSVRDLRLERDAGGDQREQIGRASCRERVLMPV